jgi:NAD(P)H-flavin reductase
LKEPIEKDLFLICTGTGIAPFRSMVHHIRNKKIQYHNIYLIFGCRNKADLLYYEEKMSGFHFHPVLSREHWEGHNGRVHAVYQELCKERPEAFFFLCGWKHMIDEAKTNILEMGYEKKAIHQELYG